MPEPEISTASFLDGATRLDAGEFYEKDGKHYAKFFLISDKINLKKWAVTPESIPARIRTFIGRPYISEPKLEHFGADDLPLDQVLKQQESYRKGTIVAVDYNASSNEAAAVVEITDEETWAELLKGKAIYVSPAVAGASMMVEGAQVFYDWFGLHLARVKQPAYGVFYATIKATCTGSERECVQNLIATASVFISSNDSFNLLEGHCSKNIMSTVQTTKTAPTIEDLAKAVASLQEELKTVKTANDGQQSTTSNPSPAGQTTPVTDAIPEGEKQTRMASASEKELNELRAQIASLQADKKAAVVSELVTMKRDAGVYASQTEEDEEKKKMMASASVEEVERAITMFQPIHAKIMQMGEQLGRLPNTENRVIKVASASEGGDSRPTSLEDLRKIGVI